MKKIAVVVKGYPRLSETFIAQEFRALELAGIDLTIYSLRRPTDAKIHAINKQISARVVYLPEYLYQEPIRVFKGLGKALGTPPIWKLLGVFVRDFCRDFSVNRIRRLGQAMVLAREIDADTEWLYAHFLHTPASVTRYTSLLTQLPWSCSAHAKDIWTSPKWEIDEKLAEMQWLVTCTKANQSYLNSFSNAADKVSLLYHGLDVDRFSANTLNPLNTLNTAVETADAEATLRLLSVGRAVHKKGFDDLLESLAQLPKTLDWRFTHIGGGPLLERLQTQAAELGVGKHITWLGACDAAQVLACYRSADLFVLFSKIDDSGDRDGLPNVLMEAMSQGLPCISTTISGIPELIEHNGNGVLVAEGDVAAMTQEITRLHESPQLRKKLSVAARATIVNHFNFSANIQHLIQRFS